MLGLAELEATPYPGETCRVRREMCQGNSRGIQVVGALGVIAGWIN